VSAAIRPILASSCARAATAAEARFRIDRPIGARAARVVALDDGAAEIVARVATEPWRGARFFTDEVPTQDELADADLVIMVATADGRAEGAAAIAQVCAARGIMTAGLILGERLEAGEAVSALRPYARVLMVTEDEHDVSEVLTALRA
jgi:hypothetical protein